MSNLISEKVSNLLEKMGRTESVGHRYQEERESSAQ